MSKHDGITLSPHHGVNPSLNVCFWCGKDKGVALLGKLKGDAPAPRRILLDYDPCTECEEKMESGVTLIGVTREPQERPEIAKGLWPTGAWCVLKPEAMDHIFEKEGAEKARKAKRALVPHEVVEHIMGVEPETQEEEQQ